MTLRILMWMQCFSTCLLLIVLRRHRARAWCVVFYLYFEMRAISVAFVVRLLICLKQYWWVSVQINFTDISDQGRNGWLICGEFGMKLLMWCTEPRKERSFFKSFWCFNWQNCAYFTLERQNSCWWNVIAPPNYF